MRKYVAVVLLVGITGLAGCGRVAPAALKAVAGEGAKMAPKAAAQPAKKGEFWNAVRNEGITTGAEHGAKQLIGDNKKRR